MDEEDCDYRTPIGKVIKQINHLCKKPRLDNQLSEVRISNDTSASMTK